LPLDVATAATISPPSLAAQADCSEPRKTKSIRNERLLYARLARLQV
jgi:hypothetical protein